MRASNDRKKILTALDGWLAGGERSPVVRVLEGKRPANAHPAFFMEVPRLIVGLVGRGTFLTMEEGREVVFDLLPGQVLFLAPFTWICPVPRMAYRSLGVIFRRDSTRLTVHARRAASADGTVPSRYLAQWRTQETLGPKGEHLLQLLREPPAARLGERTFNLVLEILLAEVAALVERASEHVRPTQTVLWQSVCDYLSEHWSDPQLSREGTARFFNRHPNHFSRFFHDHSKQNFRTYVNEIRLERSVHFLRDLRYNVTDVAGLCGFTDLQYFIRCFRQRFGFTPGEYRKRRED
ncbi:MAG: AraC family transcriptional regulator [Opitutus sp.]|nr:AraC family transcriptional regulator [Opitutus sp.]